MPTTAKTLVAVLAAVLAAVLPGLTGDTFGLVELVNVTILAAGAIQVFNAGNLPSFRYAKTVAAAVAALGVVFISAWTDFRISPAEVVQMILAVLGAVGVATVPNGGTQDGVFISGRHALPA